MSSEVITKYATELQSIYHLYANKIQELICSILRAHKITPHSVTWREKSPSSLHEKIGREGKSYADPLNQITDLAGVRIIMYFPKDVDRILPLLEEQFLIDRENSVDKRKTNDPSIFGYSSVHLVVQLNASRCALPEYSLFKGLKCEIQVRTILQHAWAEIEHDIVYKSNEEIPFELRRKFASLSGLLEVADREFELIRYEEHKVREDIKRNVAGENLEVPINLDSLRFYLEKYHKEKDLSEAHIGRLVRFLAKFRVETLAQFHEMLSEENLKSAKREVDRIKDKCPHCEKCLLCYFIAIGMWLEIDNYIISDFANCRFLFDQMREKGRRVEVRKSSRDEKLIDKGDGHTI